MNKKLILVANKNFQTARKKSLISNVEFWCKQRDIEYDFCLPEELSSLNNDEVGAVYKVLTSASMNDLTSIPDDIPLIIDMAIPLKSKKNIFVGKKIAFRNAFAQSTGLLTPEIQVPMIPRPLRQREGTLKDVIVFDVKQFHTEDTHFYVMSLIAQLAREWQNLEKQVGHKLYAYFTSFMNIDGYIDIFEALKKAEQFGSITSNTLESLKKVTIPAKDSTEEYEEILQRCRLFITEHGDIADTDLAQVLTMGRPILTYKRVAFSESTGIQHMAKKAGSLLDKNLHERIALSNAFRIKEEWGLKNIIKIDSVPPWDYDAFEEMHLKSWDILWDWAINGTLNKDMSNAMKTGGWNKGVKTDKSTFNILFRLNEDNKLNKGTV